MDVPLKNNMSSKVVTKALFIGSTFKKLIL
jgi:hypothetical protein